MMLVIFQFALANTQATTGVGELWIEYSFTMIRRKSPESALVYQSNGSHFNNNANDATAAAPLGLTPFTSVTVKSGSTYSKTNIAASVVEYQTGGYVGFDDSRDTIFNLPNVNGNWVVFIYWYNATAIATVPALSVSGGATLLSILAAGGTSSIGLFLAAGTASTIGAVIATAYDPVPSIVTNAVTLSGNGSMTDGNYDLYVMRIPDTLVTLFAKGSECDRLDYLEKMVRELTMRDEWKCSSESDFGHSPSLSSSSSSKSTKLSDSVVDLITSKLRK